MPLTTATPKRSRYSNNGEVLLSPKHVGKSHIAEGGHVLHTNYATDRQHGSSNGFYHQTYLPPCPCTLRMLMDARCVARSGTCRVRFPCFAGWKRSFHRVVVCGRVLSVQEEDPRCSERMRSDIEGDEDSAAENDTADDEQEPPRDIFWRVSGGRRPAHKKDKRRRPFKRACTSFVLCDSTGLVTVRVMHPEVCPGGGGEADRTGWQLGVLPGDYVVCTASVRLHRAHKAAADFTADDDEASPTFIPPSSVSHLVIHTSHTSDALSPDAEVDLMSSDRGHRLLSRAVLNSNSNSCWGGVRKDRMFFLPPACRVVHDTNEITYHALSVLEFVLRTRKQVLLEKGVGLPLDCCDAMVVLQPLAQDATAPPPPPDAQDAAEEARAMGGMPPAEEAPAKRVHVVLHHESETIDNIRFPPVQATTIAPEEFNPSLVVTFGADIVQGQAPSVMSQSVGPPTAVVGHSNPLRRVLMERRRLSSFLRRGDNSTNAFSSTSERKSGPSSLELVKPVESGGVRPVTPQSNVPSSAHGWHQSFMDPAVLPPDLTVMDQKSVCPLPPPAVDEHHRQAAMPPILPRGDVVFSFPCQDGGRYEQQYRSMPLALDSPPTGRMRGDFPHSRSHHFLDNPRAGSPSARDAVPWGPALCRPSYNQRPLSPPLGGISPTSWNVFHSRPRPPPRYDYPQHFDARAAHSLAAFPSGAPQHTSQRGGHYRHQPCTDGAVGFQSLEYLHPAANDEFVGALHQPPCTAGVATDFRPVSYDSRFIMHPISHPLSQRR